MGCFLLYFQEVKTFSQNDKCNLSHGSCTKASVDLIEFMMSGLGSWKVTFRLQNVDILNLYVFQEVRPAVTSKIATEKPKMVLTSSILMEKVGWNL